MPMDTLFGEKMKKAINAQHNGVPLKKTPRILSLVKNNLS
jgi:hypothetical protein